MNEAEQLLYKYYEEDNYEVVDFETDCHKKNKLCYVFFSSNGLYKDRNNVDVINKMHESGRYEWKFIASNKSIINKASRIIFLRDVFKIFYIRGISHENDSISKIKDLLADLTEDMDVIIAGSSAGAYMSLLLGSMLPNTKRIITLGGVVDLESFRTFSSYLDDNLKYCSHVNISNSIFGEFWIINFFGKKNNYDSHNGKLIEENSNKIKLINVAFNDSSHAPRPSGEDLIKILTCKEKHLRKVKNKLRNIHDISQFTFSVYNLGFLRACFNNVRSKLVKVVRKRQ